MIEVPNQKFKYKKDRLDQVMIGIVLFTLLCFGVIFYGLQYFNEQSTTRETDDRNQLNELIKNRTELERQIAEELEQ